MLETGAQSGVRSLLARFENNQNTSTSPPSRGRSPVGSDTPGSGRPLSKVRASFVAVDRAAQSSPVAGLRKESGRSDSPAVNSICSEDIDTSLRGPVSPPPSNGLETLRKPVDDSAKDTQSDTKSQELTEKSHTPKVDIASESSSVKEPKAESNPPAPVPEKPGKQAPAPKTVTKRPSNVNIGKTNPAASTATKPPSTASPKSSVHPRTSTATTKPASDRTTTMTRQSSAATTRHTSGELAKTVTRRPSRTSLNPASKTAPRTSRDTTKLSPAQTAHNSKSARLPTSATVPSLSTAKTGTTARQSGASTAASNLSRKPSTLNSAANGAQRETTQATSNVRKKTSRASLPSQSSNERPSSRVSSTGSKPVDEGFLARMMRPTASSASKTHDKVEVKSPPRTSKPAAAPKRVASKANLRTAHPKKEKDSSENIQKEKPQPKIKEQTGSKPAKSVQTTESMKDKAHNPPADILTGAEEPATEAEKAPVKPAEPTLPASTTSTEPSVEPTKEAPAAPIEPPVKQGTEESGNEPAAVPTPSTLEEPSMEATEKVPADPIESSAEPTVAESHDEPTVPTLQAPTESDAEPAKEAPPEVAEASTELAAHADVPTTSTSSDAAAEAVENAPVEPTEPPVQESTNESAETAVPSIETTAQETPATPQAEESAQQHTEVATEPNASSTEKTIPTIPEPAETVPTHTRDTTDHAMLNTKETPIRVHSVESSGETFYMDTQENIWPAGFKSGEVDTEGGIQTKETPAD